jgi:hypothetical protein
MCLRRELLMDKSETALQDYQEMWIIPDAVLAFKYFPTQEQIDKVRKILDDIEQTNKDFPIAHG